MTATPYKPISWNERELISPDKMAQLANNSQWLFENTPRGNYNAFSIAKTTGVKLACGIMVFGGAKVNYQTKAVNFGNFFAAACHPIVTTGVVSLQRRTFVVLQGLGDTHPDNRGFNLTVECDTVIERSFYVTWQAMGF